MSKLTKIPLLLVLVGKQAKFCSMKGSLDRKTAYGGS